MGAGVSSWRLARAVSRLGQLGVVSGTALDQILVRRLQTGDPDGQVRQALHAFPFPRMARRILDTWFVPGGQPEGTAYTTGGMHTLEGRRPLQELCIAGNFVEVYLARLGHTNPVGINYLEKIQLPHLPSLYGAMLAGVSAIIMGAGIPLDIPAAITALAGHHAASYPVRVAGAAAGADFRARFDPAEFIEPGTPTAPLERPLFLPIVSSHTLASIICRKAKGPIDGFVVEGPLAGGHNAPPRGATVLTPDGQPVYGPRDAVDLEAMRALGKPFSLAGAYGSPEAAGGPGPGRRRDPGRHGFRAVRGIRPGAGPPPRAPGPGANGPSQGLHRRPGLAHGFPLQGGRTRRDLVGTRRVPGTAARLRPRLPARGLPDARGSCGLPVPE